MKVEWLQSYVVGFNIKSRVTPTHIETHHRPQTQKPTTNPPHIRTHHHRKMHNKPKPITGNPQPLNPQTTAMKRRKRQWKGEQWKESGCEREKRGLTSEGERKELESYRERERDRFEKEKWVTEANGVRIKLSLGTKVINFEMLWTSLVFAQTSWVVSEIYLIF